MKKNISEAHKGIKPSKENLEKRSISMLGKNTYKRTEETKLKMSIKSKGIKKSEKHINNMRIAQQKRRLKEKQI